jgi:predicted nuclease of predicted toxin-antitoxin system
MNVFLDNNLPVSLGRVVQGLAEVESVAHVKRMGLRDAADTVIWQAVGQSGAVLLTKDEDFLNLVMQRRPPPKVALLRYGNCSLEELKVLVAMQWPQVLALWTSDVADYTILRRHP